MRFEKVRLAGPEVRKTGSNEVDAWDPTFVELFWCSSTAPLAAMRVKMGFLSGFILHLLLSGELL